MLIGVIVVVILIGTDTIGVDTDTGIVIVTAIGVVFIIDLVDIVIVLGIIIAVGIVIDTMIIIEVTIEHVVAGDNTKTIDQTAIPFVLGFTYPSDLAREFYSDMPIYNSVNCVYRIKFTRNLSANLKII